MTGRATTDQPSTRAEGRRTRRQLLAGGTGALAAVLTAEALARPAPAHAADGDPVILGASNSATSETIISNSAADVTALRVAAAGFGRGVFADTFTGIGVLGVSSTCEGVHGTTVLSGNGVSGLSGGTGNGNGVYGQSGDTPSSLVTGNGVRGFTDSGSGAGVLGENAASGGSGVAGTGGPNGVGVHGTGGGAATGVVGTGGSNGGSGVTGTGGGSGGEGVVGLGAGTGPGLLGTGGASNGTGVQGFGGSANGAGVEGFGSGSGNGVHGTATASGGVGVLAENTAGGAALQANGPAVFSRSGVLTVAAGKSSATQTGVALTAASLALATLQQDRAGVYVRSAVPNVTGSSFTIHLNKAVSASTSVAWFVVN